MSHSPTHEFMTPLFGHKPDRFSGNAGQIRAGKEAVEKDGRMLHLHLDWKRWACL